MQDRNSKGYGYLVKEKPFMPPGEVNKKTREGEISVSGYASRA
jgi:hypothetical protein